MIRIRTSPGTRVVIQFTGISIESSPSCGKDSVEVIITLLLYCFRTKNEALNRGRYEMHSSVEIMSAKEKDSCKGNSALGKCCERNSLQRVTLGH